MTDTKEVQVYFDGSCPVCRAEIEELEQASQSQCLRFIDCSESAPELTDPGANTPSQEQLLGALHVQSNGQWLSGPDAFAQIYHTAGMDRMARLWGSRRLRPLVNLGYRIFLVARPLLAALGAARVVRWLVRREARRS
ncbi:MAG: thiol-disulfide oxidoreductase DCC family protein [Lysobacterales bacterium]